MGIVEWSLAGTAPSSAKIVYSLENVQRLTLNQGGEAPVDLAKPGHRTLLLGLKQSSDYSFHVEAIRDGRTCVSPEYDLPTTGSFDEARPVSVDVARPGAREPGFIVTSSGNHVPSAAFVIDADGDVVWWAPAPQNPARAQMDYEGNVMWMNSLNLTNEGGEMRSVSMDGEEELDNVAGLEFSHHDFTVMPGGRVAALVWGMPGIDPESELVIRSPDGTFESAFTIGENLYRSDVAYHANAIHYVPWDDSFTIADRNPNVVVKVSATGDPEWQVGGTCDEAPAGNRCSPLDWEVVHGHHLLEDGTLVVFNNTYETAHVVEFHLDDAPSAFTAALVHDYTGTTESTNLGDAQRLPGGNTLVTYSSDGIIVELDSNWDEVQSFSIPVGYTNWRPTLYGPPLRP